MATGAVAFSHEISCPSCGLKFSGYLEVEPDGTGKAVCTRCGASIIQPLPKDFVAQIPPDDYQDPAHPHVHHTHYPGLYQEPKRHPRFDFSDLVKIAYAPTKAFMNLYLSSDLQRAMALVLVFSLFSVGVSVLVTVDMADIIGYNARDAIRLGFEAFAAWLLSILSFLVFSVVAAGIAKGVFGGRGERSSTIALLGYCFPMYVLVNVLLLGIFRVGFSGVGVGIQDLTASDLNHVTAGLAALVVVAIFGLLWLLAISSKAISVSNDVSIGEAGLTAILSVTATGVIYIVVSLVIALPLGLSF